MEAAAIIREAVSSVERLRTEALASPELRRSVQSIKQFQASRFRHTYSDLLASREFGPATQFFLEELYGDKDFAERDAQFGKIAKALQTLFPSQVVQTAVSLAQLHRLTEELDHAMGLALLRLNREGQATYAHAWAMVDRRSERETQLSTVLVVGSELERFTKMTGLRTMLRMMRRPAQAAGLGALQRFLESGFDTFASMSGKQQLALQFLDVIRTREMAFIDVVFGEPEIQDEALLKYPSATP